MPGPIYSITHTVHKIPFHRSGRCDRCFGRGKPACNCKPFGEAVGLEGDCPHLALDGTNACLIHDSRSEHCATCWPGEKDKTHQFCIDFPNHPWLAVIKDERCSYIFTRLNESGEVDDTPLPFG